MVGGRTEIYQTIDGMQIFVQYLSIEWMCNYFECLSHEDSTTIKLDPHSYRNANYCRLI
jgi:hypothetical protein